MFLGVSEIFIYINTFMEIVTKDDLRQFKDEILSELQLILKEGNPGQKPFLKSKEVMEMLGCSESKLASLRVSGQLPCSKIQGTYYYKIDNILALMK
jgi:Helix-turn-helix domain